VNPNDDMKYQDVVNTLSQLQQVKAPAGFEADLMRRINSESFSEERTFWQNIFAPSRLVPAGALAVTALILIFVLNTTGVTPDNPLLTAPRERSDVTFSAKTDNLLKSQNTAERDEVSSSGQTSGIQKDKGTADQPVQRSNAKNEGFSPSSGTSLAARSGNGDRFITANFTSGRITDYPVNKAGLNFRQVNLSNEQKMQLDQLKERLELMFNSRERQ
jgi:hypothetical protein